MLCSNPFVLKKHSLIVTMLSIFLCTGCVSLNNQQNNLPVRAIDNAKIIKSDENSALLKSADIHYENKNWTESAAQFEKLTNQYAQNSLFWFRYANSLSRISEFEKAANAYERLIALEPKDPRYAFNLSLVRLAQAAQAIAQAENLAPGSDDFSTNVRRVHFLVKAVMDKLEH
jgi:tetratricopeptide (TPR) repeat protein